MTTISVGIVSSPEAITVVLNEPYVLAGTPRVMEGEQRFALDDVLEGHIELHPATAGSHGSFTVKDVVIGVNFHWERHEDQTFTGSLRLIPEEEGRKITLVNVLDIEDYLKSVISSEMSATSSPALLRAHAVVSRSWLLAQIANAGKERSTQGRVDTPQERIVWYDREDHTNFDVCADDHCQRYQGVTRQTRPEVTAAVDETAGLVLKDPDNGEICDARFSKCCGGVFEVFESCWEPQPHSYLRPLRDAVAEHDFPDLTREDAAREWILSAPPAFCNTRDSKVLGEVLNDYDQETADFYRWKVEYSAEELAEIVRQRSGVDFGLITAMEAVERGTSGRIVRLRLSGTKHSMIIGKELEIRRTLSRSHLYSSAFVAQGLDQDADGVPQRWVLTGAGWGHGVGLCQIGAAMMAASGFDWRLILRHYFPGARLEKI